MGRHPDPVASDPTAPASAASTETGDPAAVVALDGVRPRGRWSRLAAVALAVVLTAALTGWAGVSVAVSVAGGAGAMAAGPSASAAPSLPPASDDGSAPPTPSAPASASAAPQPGPSATPAPPDVADAPALRPRVTTTPVEVRLQARLDAMRRRFGIPGVSATIIFRDGTTWTGTSGLADVARGVDVSAETAFAVGSVSKTYTAALILSLARERLLDLDDPAVRYLDGRALDPRITVRMLLDHTSGLDDFFLHASIDRALQAEPAAAWSARRTLRFVAKPYFPPGTGWHYSNTNYLYLGLIAEQVTGSSLGDALHDRLFAPLGLDATWYQAAQDPPTATAHGYRLPGTSRSATPVDLSDGSAIMPFTSVVTASGAAGAVAATSPDAARWARDLYTGEVLGSDMTALMLDGVAATAGYSPRVPYGLGVQAFSIDGRPTVGHSGRLLGFRAAVRHLPGEATTIAVLTNQSRADPGAIVQDLLSVVFAPDPPCLRCQDPS